MIMATRLRHCDLIDLW